MLDMLPPRSYLLFTLAGPMVSWGDITVGEIRSTWDRPSKSAVLGLVAAALGIPRTDEATHQVLHQALGFAVRVNQPRDGWGKASPALALRDFHTVQAPSSRKGAVWTTRSDELSGDDLNTILSERWYLIDRAATVALWQRTEDFELSKIADALQQPAFTLYLGRKSCPLGQPPAPSVIEAASLLDAFAAYRPDKPAEAGSEIWADTDHGAGDQQVSAIRHDTPLLRRAWTFESRMEHRLAATPAQGAQNP